MRNHVVQKPGEKNSSDKGMIISVTNAAEGPDYINMQRDSDI